MEVGEVEGLADHCHGIGLGLGGVDGEPQLPAVAFQDEQLALQARRCGDKQSEVIGVEQGWHSRGAASQEGGGSAKSVCSPRRGAAPSSSSRLSMSRPKWEGLRG